jgi:hypothetical protein
MMRQRVVSTAIPPDETSPAVLSSPMSPVDVMTPAVDLLASIPSAPVV